MLILAFAMAAAQATRAQEALPIAAEASASCSRPAAARHGLLGGLAKGFANAAPLIGSGAPRLQIVTGIAGQALAASAAARSATATGACDGPAS